MSNTPVISDIERSTASLVLDKREPVVVKYASKSSKKSGRKNTEEENEKLLVCGHICVLLYYCTVDMDLLSTSRI